MEEERVILTTTLTDLELGGGNNSPRYGSSSNNAIRDDDDDDVDGLNELQQYDEEISAFARRCDCLCSAFCTLMGSCIRGLFASSILALCLFVFIIIVQAAWGVFFPADDARRYNVQNQLTPAQRYSRNDEIASAFPLCASQKRTMHPFIRNICWRPNAVDDGVAQFAVLISRTLMDLDVGDVQRKRLFLVDAIYTQGSTLQGEQATMGNMPATRGGSVGGGDGNGEPINVFRFDASPDGMPFCDVTRESTWLEEPLAEGVLATLPILKLEDDEVWLDCTSLVKRLFFAVPSPAAHIRRSSAGGASGRMPVDSVRVRRVQVFPRNAIVSIDLSTTDALDLTSPPLVQSIAFSLSLLSETPDVARQAHPAVGYFTSSIRLDRARPAQAVEGGGRRLRMIHRRRGGGKEFVFYIDPSVPVEYRQAVRRGAEMWNLALNPLGRAVRIVLPPPPSSSSGGDGESAGAEAWPRDYAVADIRYSTISWSVALDRTFAIAPNTVDPRSGEILNSDIVLSDKWMFAWTRQMEALFPDAVAAATAGSTTRRHLRCMKQQHFGAAAAAAASTTTRAPPPPDYNTTEFLLAGLSDVVAHEVGHALGLRHNFKGSLQVPFTKLADADYLREFGLSSSVMDYLDVNPHFPLSPMAFTSRIGSYDMAAIRYGYDDNGADGSAGEDDDAHVITTKFGAQVELASAPHLTAIAGSAGAYGTDEDALIDPEAAIFDLSAQPVRFGELQAENVLKRRPLVAGAAAASPSKVDVAHRVLSSQLLSAARVAAAYVGGKVLDRSNADAASSFVPLDRQQAALKLVLKLCTSRHEYFSKTSWMRTCEVSGGDDGACAYEGQLVQVDARAHARAAKRQMLRVLVLGSGSGNSNSKLERLGQDGAPLSLSKFLDTIVQHLFDPVQDATLWDAQSDYIDILLGALKQTKTTSQPQHVLSAVKVSLDHVLAAFRTRALSSTSDFLAHASLCQDRIKHALERLHDDK